MASPYNKDTAIQAGELEDGVICDDEHCMTVVGRHKDAGETNGDSAKKKPFIFDSIKVHFSTKVHFLADFSLATFTQPMHSC
jgi:hypothetical protein